VSLRTPTLVNSAHYSGQVLPSKNTGGNPPVIQECAQPIASVVVNGVSLTVHQSAAWFSDLLEGCRIIFPFHTRIQA
jgi:hypothetical protein